MKRRQIEIDEEIKDIVANFSEYEFYDEDGFLCFQRCCYQDRFWRFVQRSIVYVFMKAMSYQIDHSEIASFITNDFYQQYEESYGIFSDTLFCKVNSPERRRRIKMYQAKKKERLAKLEEFYNEQNRNES